MTGTRNSAGPTLAGALLDQRYRVTALIARGGMASVYRGVDTRLDRPIAIKVMHEQFAADRSFVARFEREARAAAKVHHPNVVTVHDQGIDPAGDAVRAFLVMELVDGGTLRDLLDDNGPLDPALAVSITVPVLSALAAAHRAGLVHRDVKPENVLIGHSAVAGADEAVAVKVADFGLVRAIASAGTTSASIILGTVAYLSPEQVATGEATERSDVYSAGLLLYEMLTGQQAVSGDTPLSIAYQHVNADVPPPSATNPDVPAALDKLVVRATSRDSAARPADAAAFLAELERVRAEQGWDLVPVPAQPAPGAHRLPERPTVPGRGPGRGTRTMTQATAFDPPDEPDERAPSRRPVGLWVAVVTLAVLLLAGLTGAGLWFVDQARDVDVPPVAGLTQVEAERVLAGADLTVSDVVHEWHDDIEGDRAIGTDPEAGTGLRRDDEVVLMMSLGRPAVPDIAPGTSLEEATEAIAEVELVAEHDPEGDDYHESIAEGTVLSVSPEAGTALAIGSTVTLSLSLGPPPTPVPDVTGLDSDDAFAKLRAEGFEPYDAGEEFDADIERGKVVRTDPAHGATPEEDTPRVGVYVSNAVEVPRVVGMRRSQAEQELEGLDLRPEVVQGSDRGFAIVYQQDPEPGTRLAPGSTVQLAVVP